LRLVSQQSLRRDVRNETFILMTKQHGMTPARTRPRALVLEHPVKHLGRQPRRPIR
jgi:hypothetical protein